VFFPLEKQRKNLIKMLLLFETASGYAVFKVLKEKKLNKCENVFEEFNNQDKLSKLLALQHFEQFKDIDEAVKVTSNAIAGKLPKKLKKLLSEHVQQENEQLAVADSKLGNIIKEKLDISCIANTPIQQLMNCIRQQANALIPNLDELDNNAMQLALAHGMSRFKLKFSSDKIDMMIIHAVSLLDDLDKELNNYIMRCKEWYGWHFPELAKIVADNEQYIKTILAIGVKENASNIDLSEFLDEKKEQQVKEMAEVSMGTEITEEDMLNIVQLCKNVLDLYEYRTQLFEYIKNRMMAIAPNLAILVGELVGARLISKAGSLLNLAKYPASTVQILGAEKALFRALKTKNSTPKYGLIYHAQLIGLSNQNIKGKMSRALAAKAALSCRVDALGESSSNELGIEHKSRLEAKLKFFEEGGLRKLSKQEKKPQQQKSYEHKQKKGNEFKAASDFPVLKKREREADFEEEQVDEKPDEQSPTEEASSSTNTTPKTKKQKKNKKTASDSSATKKREQPEEEQEDELEEQFEEQPEEQSFVEEASSTSATPKKKKNKKNKKLKREKTDDE